jgi:hypothetical protein
MNNPFEASEILRVVKDNRTQSMTINGAIGMQDAPAERPDNFTPCRFARPGNFTRQFIGIDHDGAAFLEHLRHGAFPCGDAPRESD